MLPPSLHPVLTQSSRRIQTGKSVGEGKGAGLPRWHKWLHQPFKKKNTSKICAVLPGVHVRRTDGQWCSKHSRCHNIPCKFHFPLESFMSAMAMCKLLPLSPQMAQRGRGSSHGMLWCMPYLPHHPPSGYASNVFNSLLSDRYGYLCLSGCHTMMGKGSLET